MDLERRRALLTVAPLAVIAIGFFLPPFLPGSDITPISPFADDLTLYPPFHVVALALAALTALGVARRTPPGVVAVVLAWLGIVGCGSLTAWLVELTLTDGDAITFTVSCSVLLIAALSAGIRATRRSGWARWFGLLETYALVALPYGCPRILGAFNLFSGGYVFVAADVVLLGLVATRYARTP